MRVGLSFDLKTAVVLKDAVTDDALEEYDSPTTIGIFSVPLKDSDMRRSNSAAGRNLSQYPQRKGRIVFILLKDAVIIEP